MSFQLPELPYAMDGLQPHISKETLEFHYGKHHKAYVDKANDLVKGTEWESKSLEEIIRGAGEGPLFNNVAQIYNHTFYWHCLSPNGGGAPAGKVGEAITKAFGDFETFKAKFTEAALTQFGSGWAWLVQKGDGSLTIEKTPNAGCPLKAGLTPLLTCDVWEHAYYIDYRNARPKYVEAFWNLVNWDFVEKNMK